MDLVRKIEVEIQKRIKTLDRQLRDEYMEIGGLESALDIIDDCKQEYNQNNCTHEVTQINSSVSDFYGKCVKCGKYFK